MRCRLFAIILVLSILGSGTALAGFGEGQKTADRSMSMPEAGATSAAHARDLPILTATAKTQAMPAALCQQAPPSSQQKRLLHYDVESAAKSLAYYNGRYLPWNGFSGSIPKNAPLFWVATSEGWSWDASLPLGAWVQELMYIPEDGTLKMYEIYPSGASQRYVLGFPSSGYYYIWFYGDIPGKHITIFTVDDEPSNAVMIDILPKSRPTPPYPGAIV